MTQSIKSSKDKLKNGLRQDMIMGGLGARLAKTWRGAAYPGGSNSLSAAGTVWSNAPHIVESMDKGAIIRSRDGLWLAIPTDSAPKRGIGRKRLSPSNFPEHRFGPLRFVYRKTGPSLLVVDDQRRTKAGDYTRSRSQRALASKTGLSTVVMFTLHRQVKMRRRLNVKKTADRHSSRVGRKINAAFRRLDRKGRS